MRNVIGALCLTLLTGPASAGTVDDLLAGYKAAGAKAPSAQAGQAMWEQAFDPQGAGEQRKCSTCHGSDLKRVGKHTRTGKAIEPMAPSVNRERLSDPSKVEKWFKRNCKWTLGRECTVQEKADFLVFMRDQ